MSEEAPKLIKIDDPIQVIRKYPDMYGGKTPRSARMAGYMVQCLLTHNCVPLQVEVVDNWWVIISQKDWLRVDGKYMRDYWTRIVPTPEIGSEAIRGEVILHALSKCLFTIAAGSIEFIEGENSAIPPALQPYVDRLTKGDFPGRAVFFLME